MDAEVGVGLSRQVATVSPGTRAMAGSAAVLLERMEQDRELAPMAS